MDFYVTEQGNDSNDGLTWWTAFRTVHKAAESLPRALTGGGFMSRTGQIFVGPGYFVEPGVVNLSGEVHVYGSGANNQNKGGTVVEIDIEPEVGYDESSAFFTMENLALYGQVTLNQGGFQCGFRNVNFGNALGWGVRILNGCNDVYFDECSAGGCRDGWIYVNFPATANLGHLKIRGGQIDSCGPAPIQIDCNASGVNYVDIQDVKFESVQSELHRDAVLYRPLGGSNGVRVTMMNCIAWKQGALGRGLFTSETGVGGYARFVGINCDTQNYDSPWYDIKNGKKWGTPNLPLFSNYDLGSYNGTLLRPVNI